MQSDFFIKNRARLIEKLKGGLCVLSAFNLMQLSNDGSASFEQESNFWWLTGIDYPNWQLMIDGTTGKSCLICPDIDPISEIFDGGLSADEARLLSGVDKVISTDEADILLRNLAKKHSLVYSLKEHPQSANFNFVRNPAIKNCTEKLERIFNNVMDCRNDLAVLRSIKQVEEIKNIKKAISTTIKGFDSIKKDLSEFRYEYEVEAEFTYLFRRLGLSGHAYQPIIACGRNACTLHYVKNNSRLKKHQLILIDVGARYNNYSADISRTYSIDTPTKRQIAVHNEVEEAQLRIIKLLKPGLLISEYSSTVDEIMKDALMKLGLMSNRDDLSNYQKYFPHAISHGLGIDTHDSLGAPKYFEQGMIITVEPGIYIPDESIGVRIEDDILITAKGHENMSSKLSTSL